MRSSLFRFVILAAWLLIHGAVVQAADAPSSAAAHTNSQFHVREVDEAWRNNLPLDAEKATQLYMDRLPAEVVKRSNDYFEGGYWLQLWNFILGLVIAAVMLAGKRSAHVRDWAQRIGRKAFFRDAIYAAVYSLAVWILSLPMTIYEGFLREHAYGMATQQFGGWFGEQITALLVSTLMLAIAIPVLYAAVRRAGEHWWLWGSGVATIFLALILVIEPIWIDPLFNDYKPLQDGEVKSAVIAMARANGVPTDNVYWFDASRQTTRVSANVSGIFGSASIRLNDNLLNTSLPEIRAVTGHEIGHYVLHHVYATLILFALLAMMGLLFARWLMSLLLRSYAQRFALNGISDIASLPMMVAVLSVFLFLATPVTNTVTRVQETEADRFGFNLARDPLGAAEAYLKLTEYRKPDPGPIEEFIFFDHPGTRTRIYNAMTWRENMMR